MQRSTNELIGYKLLAKDGVIGRCKDFLVDDRDWSVRNLVADTGKWLSNHRVIVAPSLLGEPSWKYQTIPIQLTQKELKEAPPVDDDAPVSRIHEKEWLSQFGQAFYWGLWGPTSAVVVPAIEPNVVMNRERGPASTEPEEAATHVRSLEEIKGYAIRATDGEVGAVKDFIADDASWRVRYMVVDTNRWTPGGKVLLSTDWIKEVNWVTQEVAVDVDMRQVENSPAYDPRAPVNREYEVRLYDYYGRPKYWIS